MKNGLIFDAVAREMILTNLTRQKSSGFANISIPLLLF
jgi:hypothetical protein